jgi:hypothetical protein
VGPQAGSTASFDLTVGTWTISVEVDDVAGCLDVADDARCSPQTLVVVPPGGRVIPGDANGDAGLDISDAVALLGFLFLGGGKTLPCGDGTVTHPGNISFLDWQPDGMVDISDAVAMLSFLFLGGSSHTLAVPGSVTPTCVPIAGCADRCGQ